MVRLMSASARRLVISSRAEARLEAARTWLAGLPADAEVLVLAPHAHAAAELVRSVVERHGSRFGIQRLTLDRLAAMLAAPELARRGLAPATSLSIAAVAARGAHRLAESGGAGRYAEVARRPGFSHALVRTFGELRAAGVAPEALRALPEGGDLAALVERIEAELAEVGLADRAAILLRAREAVERGAGPPVGVPLLLLDLALEQALEARLVAALAARAPAVLAVAPTGDASVARLEAALDARAEVATDSTPAGSLAALQSHLFEETGPKPAPLDDGVTLASWPGEARECVEIARGLLAEAAAGTRFDRMAVFVRSASSYRAHLEEALRRASIPVWFARGTTRPEPAGRAFLALLACAAEGLSARRFAEYLSLAQVPDPGDDGARGWAPPSHDLLPATLDGGGTRDEDALPAEAEGRDGTPRAPWRWERLLVDAAVIGGRERWQRRLDGLAQELEVQRHALVEDEARAGSLARIAGDLAHLRDFALPVIGLLAALPVRATWATWLECLRSLAAAAIRHPQRVNAVLAELEPLAPVGPVDLADVQHVLAPRLRDLTEDPARRPEGAVFVGPIEAARGLAFDVVFVPGLAERMFPAKLVEDPLLPDEARRALEGVPLAVQDARVATERMHLRIAAGAARRRLALSWPQLDLERDRPRVPSFYGLEALRAAEGRLPGFDDLRRRAESTAPARLGWPAPERAEDAIDDAEYDLATLARVDQRDAEASRGAARYLLGANPNLARALRARGRRWLKRWTVSDGLVDPDAEALAALGRHAMGQRSFSPTALENFAACPYRFLLQAIHRLQPRREADPLETIDPLTRGALFHEVQFDLLTALREEGRLPFDPARLEPAFERLNQVVDRVAAAYAERLAPAIPRVWTDGIEAIRTDLREWLRRSAEAPGGWVPHRFELSFGLADRRRPTEDAASVPDDVTVLDGVRLRGSIDLVEKRGDGTFRVTDHKTGKARVPDEAVVNGGQTLQPVLYALVAESVLGGPVESGRLYYCTADGDFTERVIPLDQVARHHAAQAAGTVARALERGFLPAAPVKDACRWCDYRPVCGPHEESRTARKPADRLAELDELRSLP